MEPLGLLYRAIVNQIKKTKKNLYYLIINLFYSYLITMLDFLNKVMKIYLKCIA